MRELVRYHLMKADLRVLTATGGLEALATVEASPVDLAVLDLALPDMAGIEVCRRFRQRSRAPVMILSDRHSELDRVRALEAGADDFVNKPFSSREFMTRVQALLRRWTWQSAGESGESEIVTVGPLTLEIGSRQAYYRGQSLHTTPMEFAILRVLCRAPGQVLPRERILALATGREVAGDARTVDVHIRSLRLKLEPDPASPRFLETVRGAGYCLGRNLPGRLDQGTA